MDKGATNQWNIVHGEYYHPLVLRCIFGDSSEMGLDDVVAVQKWHLSIRLDPYLFTLIIKKHLLRKMLLSLFLIVGKTYLVLGILRNDVEGGDV